MSAACSDWRNSSLTAGISCICVCFSFCTFKSLFLGNLDHVSVLQMCHIFCSLLLQIHVLLLGIWRTGKPAKVMVKRSVPITSIFFFLVEVNWFVILGMLFWWIIGIIYQNGYSWCFFLKQLDIIFAVVIWFLWSMSSSKPPRLASSQLPRTYFNEMETQVSSLFMLQREPWFHRSGLVPCWWSIDYSTTR